MKHLADGDEGTQCLTAQIGIQISQEIRDSVMDTIERAFHRGDIDDKTYDELLEERMKVLNSVNR